MIDLTFQRPPVCLLRDCVIERAVCLCGPQCFHEVGRGRAKLLHMVLDTTGLRESVVKYVTVLLPLFTIPVSMQVLVRSAENSFTNNELGTINKTI